MCSTSPRPAFVLVVVLVVLAMLSLAGLSFLQLMVTERGAALITSRQLQVRAAADSGLEMARRFVSVDEETQNEAGGWYDNPLRFQMRLVVDDERARKRCRFSVVAPALDEGMPTGTRFGLEDESTRLNLNVLVVLDEKIGGARDLLMGLPNMDEYTADAILDWIDDDDEEREYGAESNYYLSLDPAYQAKNGPLETVEELLLVRGITPQLLLGSDFDRNGLADENVDTASSDTMIATDGSMDRGWSAYLTLHSAERNLQPDGQPKVDLNTDDMEALYNDLGAVLPGSWATFIVAFRQNGPYEKKDDDETVEAMGRLDLSEGAGPTLTTVLDLIGPAVRVTLQGDDEPTVLKSPFPDDPMAMGMYLPVLMDFVTINASPVIPGRINVNQASRSVLAGVPGMTDEILEEIISFRRVDRAEWSDLEAARRHETWLLSSGIVTLDEMKSMIPFLTGTGHVYRAQVVGYFEQDGPAARIEAIFDATTAPARLVFWRDISHLGPGYAVETLGIEASD
ncbi:MAG: general secretion pathway protein GspK [Planctomycetes bacterium]|nr:general secretion pathway protein GspK [Planctomycetota bacterium]